MIFVHIPSGTLIGCIVTHYYYEQFRQITLMSNLKIVLLLPLLLFIFRLCATILTIKHKLSVAIQFIDCTYEFVRVLCMYVHVRFIRVYQCPHISFLRNSIMVHTTKRSRIHAISLYYVIYEQQHGMKKKW